MSARYIGATDITDQERLAFLVEDCGFASSPVGESPEDCPPLPEMIQQLLQGMKPEHREAVEAGRRAMHAAQIKSYTPYTQADCILLAWGKRYAVVGVFELPDLPAALAWVMSGTRQPAAPVSA